MPNDSVIAMTHFSQPVLSTLIFLLSFLRRTRRKFFFSVKLIEDILITDIDPALRRFISAFNLSLKVGEISEQCSGSLGCLKLHISQDDDYAVTIHGDNKLNAFERFPISCNRHCPD